MDGVGKTEEPILQFQERRRLSQPSFNGEAFLSKPIILCQFNSLGLRNCFLLFAILLPKVSFSIILTQPITLHSILRESHTIYSIYNLSHIFLFKLNTCEVFATISHPVIIVFVTKVVVHACRTTREQFTRCKILLMQ